MKQFLLSNYYYFVAFFTALYCMAFIAFLANRFHFSRASRAFALFLISVFMWAIKDAIPPLLIPYVSQQALMRICVALSPMFLIVVIFAFSMFVSIYNASCEPQKQFGHERTGVYILCAVFLGCYIISLVYPPFMYADFTKGTWDYEYSPGLFFIVFGALVIAAALVPALFLLIHSRKQPHSESFIIPLGGILSLAVIMPSNILAMEFGIETMPRLGALSISVMCACAFYGIKRYGRSFSVREVIEERDKLQMIGDSLNRLMSTPDEAEICQSICDYAQEISDSLLACIVVFNEDYTEYEIRAASYSTQVLKDTVFAKLPFSTGTRYPLLEDSVYARQILDSEPYECESIEEFFVGQLDSSVAAKLDREGRIRQVVSYPIVVERTVKGSVVLFRSSPVKNIALYRIFAAQCSLALTFSSHIRQLEDKQRLEEMLHQSHKMDALGQLAGGVAHDLNNMLAGISGYIDIIKRSFAKDNPRLASYVETMNNASEKASDLISKLLTFARKGKYQIIPVNVHNVIYEVIQLLVRTIDKRIQIVERLYAQPPMVMGDPAQLQNAILNLALNARDAMPSGGQLVFTTTTGAVSMNDTRNVSFSIKEGDYLILTVQDSGIGMSRDVLDHMYEPFYTTKGVGKGTGLGLSSVYGCVKNHNGYILSESEPNKGTTFTVYLPLLRSPAEAAESPASPLLHEEHHHAEHDKGHIIIIDDEPIVRNLCKTMLNDYGYFVTTFEDAREAVNFYKKHHKKIDLAIIDMIMPHMNGSECFKALYKINPEVKAILATGYDMSERTQEVLTKSIAGFLQKPFKESTLLKMISEVLESPTHAQTGAPLRG